MSSFSCDEQEIIITEVNEAFWEVFPRSQHREAVVPMGPRAPLKLATKLGSMLETLVLVVRRLEDVMDSSQGFCTMRGQGRPLVKVLPRLL